MKTKRQVSLSFGIGEPRNPKQNGKRTQRLGSVPKATATSLLLALVAMPLIKPIPAHSQALNWSGWSEVPGGRTTDVALGGVTYHGALYLFARGFNDSRIYMNTYNDSSWAGWTEVAGGGTTDVGLGAAVYEDSLYLFGKGIGDQGVYANRYSGGTWSGWSAVPGSATTHATLNAALYFDALNLFREGTDNHIYLDYLGLAWNGWLEVPPGSLTTDTALRPIVYKDTTLGGDSMYVFAKGASDRYCYVNKYHAFVDSQTWSGWSKLPVNAATDFALAGDTYGGYLYLFLRGDTQLVYVRSYDGTTYSAWTQVPSGATTDQALCAVNYGGFLYLFRTGTDQHIYLNKALSATALPDLTVTGLEITQGTQYTQNNFSLVPLVAQRSVAVRATIGVAGSVGAVANVYGRLHVFVGGREITPSAGVPAINEPFTAPLAPDRANENDTLNFELPAPTGITAATSVGFRVDVTGPNESNANNNSLFVGNLNCVNRATPLLYYVPIDYTFNVPSPNLPAAALIQPGVGDAFVRGILPVNDGDPLLYQQANLPAIGFAKDLTTVDVKTKGGELLSKLEKSRQLIVKQGVGASDRVFLYGWVAGALNGNGLAKIGGRVGFGNTEEVRHQRSYAHELTHNFGFNHVPYMIDQIGWDVGARLQNNPMGNNTTGRLKPLTLFDIQVAGLLTSEAWIDLSKYLWLLGDGDANPLTPANSGRGDFAPDQLLVTGIMNPEGTQAVLNHTLCLPWLAQPTRTNSSETYQFAAQITDSVGAVTKIPFNALIAADAGHSTNGFFSVVMPLKSGRTADRIVITPLTGTNQLAQMTRSAVAPQVQILSPLPGATFSAQTTVAFSVSDPDSPASNLEYQVCFSPDDGLSWVPVAVNLAGGTTSVTFDSTQVQNTHGHGRIRVFASDGLNTASADVTNLTTVAGTFENPLEPRLFIANLGTNVAVSWFTNAPGFTLQVSSNLTTWGTLSNTTVVSSNRFIASSLMAGQRRYFRLLCTPGTALSFDGTDDRVVISNFLALVPTSEITVEFWQKATAPRIQSTFSQNAFNPGSVLNAHVPYGDGRVYWDFGDIGGGGRLSYTPPVSIVGSWQHFALVASQSGNYMRIYRNGTLEASKTGMTPFVSTNLDFAIGGAAGLSFSGELDEFRIWNVARTQSEIQAFMKRCMPLPQDGLVAYWPLDEGAGLSAADSSGQAPSGLLLNGPVWLQSTVPFGP